MRFRYFDSDGTEVEISSVDALKFRIGTGAVTPETLLYDAAVEKWAPAGRHQVFRFIVEEDEDVLPDESRETWEEARAEEPVAGPPDAPAQESAPSEDRLLAGDIGPEGSVSPSGPPRLPSDPDRRPRQDQAPEEDSADAEAADDEEGTDPAPEPEESGGGRSGREEGALQLLNWGPEAVEEEAVEEAPSPERSDAEDAPAAPEVAAASGQGAAVEPAGPPRRPSSDPRVREIDIPARLVRTASARDSEGSEADGRSRPDRGSLLRGGRFRIRWVVLAALLVGGGGLLVYLAENGAGVLAADGADAAEADAGQVLSVAAPASGGGARRPPAAPETGAAGTGDEGARPLPAGELESLAAEVAGAVSGDLAGAMAELQAALGVSERPPEAWLQGAYLADAGRHPEVREYWRAYGAFVTSVRALEEDLYRGFVQNRVLKMGLDTASAAGLSARVLERYERSAEKRELVYDDLEVLSREALALHDILAARSEVISYEPFSGRTLSRDPVVEAVADDPELAEVIWSRMDRIFERLDRVQGLQPVSTLRLQEALLSGLRIPARGNGGLGGGP